MIRRMPFEQTLVGSYRPEGATAEQSLELNLTASASGGMGLFAAQPLEVSGSVFAEGLARRATVSGQVDLRRLSTGASAYSLSFQADDGRTIRLVVRRRAALGSPLFAFSQFLGELRDDSGAVLASVELRVDLRRTLRRWLVM